MSIKKTAAKTLLPPLKFVLSELKEKQKRDEERKKMVAEEKEKRKAGGFQRFMKFLIGAMVVFILLFFALLFLVGSGSLGSTSAGETNMTTIIDAYGQNPPVVIEIYSESCPHCKDMNDVIAEFRKENPDVNIMQIESSGSRVSVQYIPTLVIVRKDGTHAERVGAMGMDDFKAWVGGNYY
ncbi:MAG: hypothetical protein MSIBF_01390 [Candidatus Altiarchaeales archaeon IMC4]|nr:MAG: hypothetical protein MSIBF_01390 [Candidatus Altiarchaeales archaeon IMC4]